MRRRRIATSRAATPRARPSWFPDPVAPARAAHDLTRHRLRAVARGGAFRDDALRSATLEQGEIVPDEARKTSYWGRVGATLLWAAAAFIAAQLAVTAIVLLWFRALLAGVANPMFSEPIVA